MKRILYLVVILFLFSGCFNPAEKQSAPKADQKTTQDSITVVTKPFATNPQKIEYEIPVLTGTQIKHGVQKRFYSHGSIYSEIPYVRNEKQGMAYTYYKAFQGEKPKVWKKQPYVNGQLNGMCYRYYESGALQSEYEYKDGLPAIGLKEYSESGKPIATPDLVVNSKRTDQYFYVTACLSKKMGTVTYHVGELVDGKYMPRGLKKLQERDGVAELLVPLDGLKTVTIIAVYSTRLTNQCILSRTIRLR